MVSALPLLPLPANPVLRIFENDPLVAELFANGIGAGEVSASLCLVAFFDEGVNQGVSERHPGEQFGSGLVEAAFAAGPFERGAGALFVTVLEDGEDFVEAMQNRQDLRYILRAKHAGIDRGVTGTD